MVIRELVDQLPEEERDVINATFYERVSLRTVGRRLGKSSPTVMRIRNRALARLRAGMLEGAEWL